jgi:dynactin complex subunit
MTEDDYKSVIAAYQQKSFELFNQNIVLETQISVLQRNIEELKAEIQTIKSLHRESENSY